MIARWGASAATLSLLTVVIAGTQLAPHPGPGSKIVAPIVDASAAPQVGLFHSAAGFDLVLPTGWAASDRTENFNRRTTRLLVISNGVQPTTNEQGLIKWSDLPAENVALEMTDFSFPWITEP